MSAIYMGKSETPPTLQQTHTIHKNHSKHLADLNAKSGRIKVLEKKVGEYPQDFGLRKWLKQNTKALVIEEKNDESKLKISAYQVAPLRQ